jgi:hypothetical protein
VADDDGDFVVVWQGYDRSAPNLSRGIFGQRFDAMGAVLGGGFLVNTYITGTQNHAEVASDPQGNFVVVWDSTDATGKPGIFGQRYEASGSPLGGEFQINGHSGSGSHAQAYPAVASADDGSFVVVWEDVHGACCGDIRGRRFDAGGTPVGDDFQISVFTPTTTSFRGPAVSADADGGFVVAWASDHEDGSEAGLFGRRYDAAGVAMGGQFQINTYTTENQWQPAVSMAADGRFVVAWSEQPDPRFDVFAQRYAGPGLTLSVDGSCPGPVTVSVVNAPPNSEVALIAAANTNGFVKGGALCPGTQFEIGEPFQLPPRFVIVDGNGTGSALLDLGENRCHVQALAFATCETSNVVAVP